jgi:hypothetical protein
MSNDNYINECKFWNVENTDQIEGKRKTTVQRLDTLEHKLHKIHESIKSRVKEDKKF